MTNFTELKYFGKILTGNYSIKLIFGHSQKEKTKTLISCLTKTFLETSVSLDLKTIVVVSQGTPEPTTILGLLAVGGLGLGLKRKKQSKQLSA